MIFAVLVVLTPLFGLILVVVGIPVVAAFVLTASSLGSALFPPTPMHLFGCIAFTRDDKVIEFVDLCSNDSLDPPLVIERFSNLRWGYEARTGVLWLRIWTPSEREPNPQWILLESCGRKLPVRSFDSPAELTSALMRDHDILVDVANTLQPLPKPDSWFW